MLLEINVHIYLMKLYSMYYKGPHISLKVCIQILIKLWQIDAHV